MKSELVPLNGDPPIPITRSLSVVGRREYCDVVVPDESLSKRHCVLVRTDGLLMVRDLATTNGTRVNGQRIVWAALLPNDRLTLGGYRMRVYLGPDDVASPSERHQAAAGLKPVSVGIGFAAPSSSSGAVATSDDEGRVESGLAASAGGGRGRQDGGRQEAKTPTTPPLVAEVVDDDDDDEVIMLDERHVLLDLG